MHGPVDIRGNEPPNREIVTKEIWLSNEEEGDRQKGKNRMEGHDWAAGVEQLQNPKWKTYEIWNGDQRAEGPVEEQNRLRQGRRNKRDISRKGMGFCLREWGVWDKCGKVPVSVGWGEEFVNGEVWLRVRGKENVGYVVCQYKFCNSKSRVNKISHCTTVDDCGGVDDLVVYWYFYGDTQSPFIGQGSKYMVDLGRQHQNIFPP